MIPKATFDFLKKEKFLSIATCDFQGQPNVAPKFLLKIKDDSIYLVDYVMNTTLKNIKINPKISISAINSDTLKGYQINGMAEVIDKEADHNILASEYIEKQISDSAERLVKSLRSDKKYRNFEAEFPEQVIILKVKIDEIVEIGLSGNIERKKI